MSSELADDQNWEACPSGLVAETAKRQLETPTRQSQQQRNAVLWGTLATAVFLTLVCYSLIEAQPVSTIPDVSVSCQTVKGTLAAFCNNRIRDAWLERAIGKHLIECKPCRKEYLKTCKCSERCPDRPRNVVTKPCCLSVGR